MAFNNEYTGIIVKRLFESGVQDSDRITLVSGEDNQPISIHRVILTAASKFSTAALGPNFQGSDQSEFIFEDIDGSMLKAIVDFCYTGRIELTEGNVLKYLAIASSRELDLLERECFLFLAEKITIKNAVQTWMIADKYSNPDVCQRALHLVCESFEKFPIENIQTFDHRLLGEVLKSESLQASEEFAFKRLMDWFRFNEDGREQYMAALLKLIRLELIPSQILNGNQFEEIFKRFDSFELIHDEYKKRSLCRGLSVGIRRRRSIFCLFRRQKGLDGAEHSLVKIERFNSASNEFEDAGEIALGDGTHFGVTLHESKVYILGGVINGVCQKSFTMFDLTTGKKEVLPEMNFPRSRCSSIVLGKYIYVFGGLNQPNGCFSNVSYGNGMAGTAAVGQTAMNTSSTPISNNIILSNLMGQMNPTGGSEMVGTVAVGRTALNRLFPNSMSSSMSNPNMPMGQITPTRGSAFLNSCERFDLESRTWKVLNPMNFPRSFASVAAFEEYIYVAGGRTNGNDNSHSVELYDPTTDEWLQIAPMTQARSSFALFKSNMCLYAMGSVASVDRFNFMKPRLQNMGSIDKSAFVTTSVETDNEIFVMLRTGEFGKVEVDAKGFCSFQLMGKSTLELKFIGDHFLFMN